METLVKEKEQCCGCKACLNICPVSAIHMELDEEGFSYPIITSNRCINCGMCAKVCPLCQSTEEDTDSQNYCQKYYAVQHKDVDVVAKSSSGGMFTALSDCILAHNGVVYGVALDSAFTVRHGRAETVEQRDSFRGSKYVQSDMGTIHSMILDDLCQHRLVLFTGTPCQVAGVRNFILLKRHTLDNLILCDFICHGVASPKVWASYIHYFEQKYENGLSHYEFRNKKDGWRQLKPMLKILDKDISDKYAEKKSFVLLYKTCYLDRPCCYSCKFTSYKRYSDITLADFWNVGAVCPEMDDNTGTSQVLVNTEIGKRWFDLCREAVRFRECNKEDMWQPHLEYPTNVLFSKRKRFWKTYDAAPFEKVLNQYGQGDMIAKCKSFAIPIVKKMGLYVLAGKLYRVIFVRKGYKK